MSKSLQQKNTYYLIIWLPSVLLAGTLLFYALMHNHTHHMQNQQLQLKQQNIWNALMERPGTIARHITGEYDIIEGNTVRDNLLGVPRDTSVYYPNEKKWVPFEILTNQYRLNGHSYRLTTYISSEEFTHLIIKVIIAETFIFGLLLGAIVIINRKSSDLLWSPFYGAMKKVREYDIIKNQPIQLATETGIVEFDQLNEAVTNMVCNVNRAYNNQKQFVENASHELQTPVAIIRSKVELLVNLSDLTEETAELLKDITDANERLSEMNKNLLLLAKIDNNQFPEQTTIKLSATLEKILTFYQHYHDGGSPHITYSVMGEIYLIANPTLIEILVINLVKNSVVHNIPDGTIEVLLNDHEIVIQNTGFPISENTEELFERFKKGREESKTTGLGLSLVKEICRFYQFDLVYKYAAGIHEVRVSFRKTNLQNLS
jgi:signal transduction histidine kinase